MRRELLELRTKLSKQESLLQSTAERLKTANQQKESMEQFIFSQCGCPRARGWERKLGKGGDFQTAHLCYRWMVTQQTGGGGCTLMSCPQTSCALSNCGCRGRGAWRQQETLS